MKNEFFGSGRVMRPAIVLLVITLIILSVMLVRASAQTQPKKIAVWFETPGSQVSSNGLQQALQVELGEGVEVLAYTTQHDDFHAVLRLMRADLSRLTPKNPSAWRQGAASTAMIFVQVIGQRASSTISRGGVAGAAVGAGVSTATNQASQGAYRNIVYKRHMEADVPLYYAFCKGKSLRLECTKEAVIWYRIRQDNDPQGGQSLWTLKGFGPDKDQIQNFPKGEAVYLYEGAGGFYRQDLLQELLFRFLLEEAGSGKPNLIGASQLAGFLQDVQAAASARFRPVSEAPTPVPTAVVSAEEQHRREVAAKLNSGGMVPMRKPQVLQQVRRCTRDELVQDGGGNWVCPPQTATGTPAPAQPPSSVDGGDKTEPFSRVVQFVFGKEDMSGHDVDAMINLLRNKGYLTVPSTTTWNQATAEDWKRMEEAFVAIGAPLTADGRLMPTEFAYWRDVLAKYPQDFAPPVKR